MEANPIAETDSKNSRYTQLQEKVLRELQEALTRDEVNTSESIAKAQFVFRKCSDEAAIEATGTSELRAELDRLGGWPLIDPNSPNGRADADLTALLIAIYRERAKQSLVLFSVLPDYENSSRYLLQFEVEAYSHIVDAYEKYLVQVARMVADESDLSIRTEEIRAGVREIDWNRFIRAAWPTELSDFIAGDPEVYVSSPEEFFALTSLMERNPATVLNYVLTSYVQQRTITLDGRFGRLAAEFARVASGTKGKEPRAEVCTTCGAMRAYVGYSPGMDDERAMDEESLFTPSSTWDEVVRIVRIERHKQELRKLLSAVSDERMAMGAVKVNAQYSFRNVISEQKEQECEVITSLQPCPPPSSSRPFGTRTFPNSHAFDNDGSQFDSNGNVFNWWNEETHARLSRSERSASSTSTRSSKFPELGIRLNGNLTQGESIADIGGLKLAFQLECTNERTSELIDEMIADVHPPSRFRVNGALANEPQFAAAFGCPPGSPLNPTERCEVW
ncbi:Phosphate-regulating neutral endopeptidase [Aphelenchoides fujianensis]|nr:Phosphate-regulating neutral endopeptidase [Aphelenchoides fujianensis]